MKVISMILCLSVLLAGCHGMNGMNTTHRGFNLTDYGVDPQRPNATMIKDAKARIDAHINRASAASKIRVPHCIKEGVNFSNRRFLYKFTVRISNFNTIGHHFATLQNFLSNPRPEDNEIRLISSRSNSAFWKA